MPTGARHVLGLCTGLVFRRAAPPEPPSRTLAPDAQTFVPFQDIPSRWAYNWHPFTLGGQHFLAHADNVVPSTLFRWDGDSFVEHQELADRHGRAFADFEAD